LENAPRQKPNDVVLHMAEMSSVGQDRRDSLKKPGPVCDFSQQNDTGIRTDLSAVEINLDFFNEKFL